MQHTCSRHAAWVPHNGRVQVQARLASIRVLQEKAANCERESDSIRIAQREEEKAEVSRPRQHSLKRGLAISGWGLFYAQAMAMLKRI